MSTNIPDLLYHLQKYYPIGLPYLYEHPRTNNPRDKVIEDKVNRVRTQEVTPWVDLVDMAKKQYPETIDFGYSQMPSYHLLIPFSAEQEVGEKILFKREFHLYISLLCPCYTQFFLDRYTFDTMKPPGYLKGPEFRIASNILVQQEDWCKSLSESMSDLVSSFFPNLGFISHKTLMNHYVTKAIKLDSAKDDGPYPIFSYLFDESFPLRNLETVS